MPFRRSPKHLPSQPKRKPSLDFSVTGLIYTSMMLFMGLAAINSQANLLFGVFGLMIGVLVIAGIISRIVLRKLDVRRGGSGFFVVGGGGGLVVWVFESPPPPPHHLPNKPPPLP